MIVYNLVEGIFFAKLICQRGNDEEIEIDTRTSDAIALAVRFKCPIYTYEFILGSAGIILDDDEIENLSEELPASSSESSEGSSSSSKYGGMSMDELETELDKAIAAEDYERASELRDEINKRK